MFLFGGVSWARPEETLEDVDVAVSLFGAISYVDPDLVSQLVSSGVTQLESRKLLDPASHMTGRMMISCTSVPKILISTQSVHDFSGSSDSKISHGFDRRMFGVWLHPMDFGIARL